MAASNFHRKIFEDPNNSTEAAEICTFQCDPLKNPSTNCIPICSFLCPSNCNTTDLSSSPPPPSPPPPSGDYFLTTPPTHHHSSLSLPLKISIVVLVCTFSFFLLYTLYKFYTVWYRSRRRRHPRSPSPENEEMNDGFVDHDVVDHPIWYIRTIGLQPSVISAINVVKYSKSDGLIDGTSCSVCLSDFVEDETLRLLPKCNHAFHVSCIDTWLRSHTNCPLCRAGIVKNVNLTNSSDSGRDLDESGRVEETRIAVSATEESNEDERQTEEDDQRIRGQIVGQSGTNEHLSMRRSVSLNDYAACRIRSDVYSNNNFYSDRHEVEIQSIDGGLGFELVKVNRTTSNRVTERN